LPSWDYIEFPQDVASRYSDIAEIDSMGSPRPRLAYVVNNLNPGGTEKLVVEMSLAFAAEFAISVVCLDEPGVWAKDLRARDIPVYCIWRQPGLDIAVPGRLASHFRRKGTQIVHAHQCTAWFYSALSRLVNRAPRVLLEEHGRFFPEVQNKARALVQRLIIRPLTHRFVAVSEDVRVRLEQYEGLDHRQVEVVYNGVTEQPPVSQHERERLRRELGFRPNQFVVGTVGRVDPIKNLPLLVNSLSRAMMEVPAVRGLLVGDGPVFSEILALVERLGMSDRVKATGFRDDARRLIQCMDLFVLSSFSEGTSMALLEAIGAGVPVLVTEVGGNVEVVVKGKTGWVVPSGAERAMTAAIVDAARNPAKRQAMAQAGKHRFNERFTFSHMIRSYREIYWDLLTSND
jgi:glycosyltransferase involved in cell wall biosynthesis